MAKKLACLMNIRNKFAHVQEVDSFESLFEKASNGTQIKNQLDNWYSIENKKDEDETYKYRFFCLAEEITIMLTMLQIEKRLEKSVLKLEKDFQKGHLESYREVVAKSEDGEKLTAEVFEMTKKKLPQIDIYKKE